MFLTLMPPPPPLPPLASDGDVGAVGERRSVSGSEQLIPMATAVTAITTTGTCFRMAYSEKGARIVLRGSNGMISVP